MMLAFAVGIQTATSQPTNTSEFVSQATQLFLAAGLSNVAGAEYRRVKVVIPTLRFGKRVADLNAWVLTDPATGKRSVVTWCGLSYTPISIGNTVDVAPNVEFQSASYFQSASFQLPLLGNESAEYMLSSRPAGPIAAALLHLAGRDDLAERAARGTQLRFGTVSTVSGTASLIEAVLADAVAARIVEEQDWDALLLARKARRFHGIANEVRKTYGGSSSGLIFAAKDWEYDAWIESLRSRLSQHTSVPSDAELARLDKSKRIEMLVTHLRDEKNAPSYIVGESVPTVDTIVTKIVREGNAGIEALVERLEDQTMSRSLADGYVFQYTFKTVGDVAYTAVTAALGLTVFGSDPKNRNKAVSHLWHLTKNQTKEMRWLMVLEEDQEYIASWEEAVRYLSLPPWSQPIPSTEGVFWKGIEARPLVGPQVALASKGPKFTVRVIKAMQKRVETWMDGGATVQDPWELVISFAAWDPHRAVPALLAAKSQLLAKLGSVNGFQAREAVGDLAQLVAALVYAKADGAWDGYESALSSMEPMAVWPLDDPFAPLWQHPDDEVAQAIAERVFTGDTQLAAKNLILHARQSLPITIYLPAFRNGLLKSLDDTSILSQATRTTDSVATYRIPNGSASERIDKETTIVPVGNVFDVRVCDAVLARLQKAMGLNGFHIALPTEKKDEFISVAKWMLLSNDTRWIDNNPETRPVFPGYRTGFPTRAVWAAPTE